MATRKSSAEVFMLGFVPIPECGCWIWTREVRPSGHGVFMTSRKWNHAHRYAWELLVGPIPNGLSVLHRCDVPPCVNPAHLFLGTQSDNMKDMASKNRSCLGEKNSMSRLNAEQIISIRALHKQGILTRIIASMFGVTRSNVSYIVNKKTWRHV
jgi:predicted XRE-type DNA-binding protein